MSKAKIIFILSFFVAVLPYSGFPSFLRNTIYTVIGLGIMLIAYILYKELKAGEKEEKTFDNFSENSDFVENKINKEKEHENLSEEKI